MTDVMVRLLTRGRPVAAAARQLDTLRQLFHRGNWDVEMHVNNLCVSVARSEVVREARACGASRLIMVDDDVVLGANGFLHLAAHEEPVVAGLVPTRKGGRIHWAAYGLDDDGVFRSIYHDGRKETRQVYAVGAAALSLGKDALCESWLDPLFDFDRNEDGTLKPFGAEDMMFCRKMHKANIPIFVDTSVMCEHVREVEMFSTMEAYACSDSNGRDTSVFEVDTRKLRIDLPVCSSYRSARRPKLGPFEIPGVPSGRMFVVK